MTSSVGFVSVSITWTRFPRLGRAASPPGAVCRTRRCQTPAMAAGGRESSPQAPMNYAAAGVDIDVESASVGALIAALGSTKGARRKGQLGALVDHAGGFSGLIEFGDRLLAMCTDGIGSKLMLAAELQYYESIAIDCVAMNVNDLLCVGAEPLAFVDYIAAPRPSPKTWAAIGRSLRIACDIARVSLCGGETATLPDMVNEIDMSGTALGWLPRGDQLDGCSVTPGDAIVGLPSSGIHSNGYTLARKVLGKSGLTTGSEAPFLTHEDTKRASRFWRHSESRDARVTLGEVLLNPTRIYVDPLIDLMKSCKESGVPCAYSSIHGMAHITGGGLSNLLRLHPTAGYHIDEPLAVHPEFQWMQSIGAISDYEMYRTFNMGMGMAIVVEKSDANALCAWLNKKLPGVQTVGSVNASGKVTHKLSTVTFDKY